MTGPKNAQGETTWGGLSAEVRYWGNWVLDRVRKEIGDLYPPIPDPEVWSTPPEIEFDRQASAWNVVKEGKLKRGVRLEAPAVPRSLLPDNGDDETDGEEANGSVDTGAPALPPGFLQPVAYLWTRTVRCKNPGCSATVPLVKQTWLCKKTDRNVALNMIAPRGKKAVRFDVVESQQESSLGFDPSAFSKAGNATCPFCGTVADIEYVKNEGWNGRMSRQLMAVVGTKHGQVGKRYLSGDEFIELNPSDSDLENDIQLLGNSHDLRPPEEPIANLPDDDPQNTLGITVRPYGMRRFKDLFSLRQQLTLLRFAAATKDARHEMGSCGLSSDQKAAITAALALVTSRFSNFSSTLCTWFYDGGRGVKHVFARQVLTMVWDYAETNPLYPKAASWPACLAIVEAELSGLAQHWPCSGQVGRGSAARIPNSDESCDVVITDPPYYDNVPYSSISDYFYVWLKRVVGDSMSEHFSGSTTPKKGEIVADAQRHGGDRNKANNEPGLFTKKAEKRRNHRVTLCV